MKILVLSDSHGNLDNMKKAAAQLRPDCILHLGDVLPDARALQEQWKGEIYMVPGNCDFGVHAMTERLLELGGVRILMMHGHRYGVKQTPLRAMYAAREQKAEILCFGHTHSALCEQQEDLWIVNPGACGGPRPTCGLIRIEDGAAECALFEIGGKTNGFSD